MTPQRFAQCNIVMRAPKGQEETCSDIHAAHVFYPDGTPVCITAWKPTPEELVRLNLGEFIYLSCIGGGMPPVALSVGSPFEQHVTTEEN